MTTLTIKVRTSIPRARVAASRALADPCTATLATLAGLVVSAVHGCC